MVEIDWKTFMGVKPEKMTEKEKENLHESVTRYVPDYNLDRKYLIHFVRVTQEILKFKAEQVELLTNELDDLASRQGKEEGSKLLVYLEEIEQLKEELEYHKKLDKSSSRSASNDELKREMVKLEMQNEELLNELNEKDKELLNEKEEVERYIAQVATLEREKLELSRELKAIQDEDRSVGSVKDSPELGAERRELTETIRQKNRHISQLLEDIEIIEEENQSLRAKLTVVRDELSETTTHITDITTELAKLRNINEDYQSRLNDSEERIKSLQCQIEELVEDKSNHDKQLDEYIAMFNTKLQEWKDEVESKDEEIMQLREEMKKLSSPRFTTTNEQNLHARIVQQEKEIEILQSELQKATDEINSSAELIEKLKEKQLKLIAAPTDTQSVKFLEEKIKLLEEKLAYAEEDAHTKAEELSFLVIQLREYESGVFGLPEAVAKIKKLEKHIRERDLQIEKLVDICNHLEIKLDGFEEQNLSLRERLGLSASDEIDTSGVKLRYRKDEELMENLKLQLYLKEEELIKAKLRYRKAIKFLKIAPTDEKPDGEIEDLNSKLLTVLKENDALRKGMHEILESVRNSSGRVEVQSACLERLLEALDSRHVSGWYHPAMRLQAQLNTEEGKNEELRNQIRSLRTEEKKRESELQNAYLKIQTLEQSTPRCEEPEERKETELDKPPITERSIIEVESTLMEMKLELDRRKLDMQNQQTAFVTERENLLTKITELESQNQQLKKANPDLGQLSELTSRIVVLERQLNFLKTSETTCRQNNDRLKQEMIEQEEKMLQDILKLQNDKSKLICKIEDLEKVIVDTIPRSKYHSLANDLANIRSRYQNAVGVSLVKEEDSRNNLQVELNLLQDEKQTILDELKVTKEKLTVAEGLISENVVTKGDFSNEIAIVAGKLAASEVRELNEKQKSVHVEKLNEILKTQLQEVEIRNKELLAQVTRLTSEVEKHQEVERSLRMRVLSELTEEDEESLRNKVHTLEKKCEELAREKDNVQELFEISQGQCRALQEWKDSDKILMTSLSEQILLLQSSDDDKAKISQLSHELAMAKLTTSQLSQQNNDLRLKITKTLSHNVTLEMKLEENRKEFRKEQEKHLTLTEYLYESLDEVRGLYGSTIRFQDVEAIYTTKEELKQKQAEVVNKTKELNSQIQEYKGKKEEMETQLESLEDLKRAVKGDTKNLITWHNKITELRLKEAKCRRQNEYLIGEISQLQSCMKKLNDEIASLEEENVEKEKDWERKQILWEKAQLQMCKLIQGKGIQRTTKDAYTHTEEIVADRDKLQTFQWKIREMEAELSSLRKDSQEKDEIIMMKDKLLMNINGKVKTIELEETVCAEKIENAEKEALKVTVQSLQNIIRQKEETILKYQDLLKEAREEYGRACSKLQDELRGMNDTLAAQSKAYSKLKNAVQASSMSENLASAVEKYMTKIHEMEDELRECETNLTSVSAQASKHQQEAEKWKSLAEERLTMLEELKQRVESEKKDETDKEEVKKYQKEVERLNQFIDLLRSDRRLAESSQEQEEKLVRLKSDQLSDCTFDKPRRKDQTSKEVESLKRQLKFSKEESTRLREQIRLLQSRKRSRTGGSSTTRSDSKTSVKEESLTSKIKHLEELLTMSKERERELMDINVKKLKSAEEVARWDERKKSQQTIQNLSGKLKEKEAEVEVLKNKNESFRKMIYKCERDKNILEAQLKAAKDGPGGLNVRMEKLLMEKQELQAEVASLQNRLEEQVRHSGGLGAALLQEKLEDQERRLASFELASKGHGTLLEELDRLKTANSNLEKANLKLESENLALQLKLEKEKAEVKDLLHRAKHYQEATDEMKRHEIERTITHLHKTIGRLTEENKRLRNFHKEPRSNQTVEKVRKDLIKLREEYEILRGKYGEAVDRNIALEDKLKTCHYQIHLMEEKDLAEILAKTDKIQQTVEMSQELAEVKAKLAQKTELLNRMKALLLKAAAKEKALLQRVRHLQELIPDAESGEDGWHPSKEIFVNPDSPIRLIYYYIQKAFEIDCDLEWDLCDESGNLVSMYEKDPWMNGTNYLVPKTTYMVVLFERNAESRLSNPLLYLHESVRKSTNQWNELMSKIRKQINPGLPVRGSRSSKSRSNTSHAK